MSLVPFTGGGLSPAVTAAALQVARHAARNPASTKKVAQVLRQAAEIHAANNLPYSTGGGKAAFSILPVMEVARRGPRGAPRLNPPNRKKSTGSAGPTGPRTQLPPVAVGTTIAGSTPTAGGRRFKVSHTALFGSVTGAAGFSVQGLRVNPGLPDIFPWLSGLCGSFDMYRIVSMRVRYVPVTGTDTEGAIYMAWDPDPEDPLPTVKAQVMANSTSVTTPVWKPASLNIPSQGVKFLRRGEVLGVSRISYDNGQLFVCQQSSAAQFLGDLYVDYTVELILPHVAANNAALYWSQTITKSTGSIAKATPLGTLPPNSFGDPVVDINTVSYPASGKVLLPLKNIVSYDGGVGTRYWSVVVRLNLQGTGVPVAPSLTCSDSAAVVTGQVATVNAGSTSGVFYWTVKWTGPLPPQSSSSLTIDASSITTLTYIELNVASVPDSITGVPVT